MARKRLHFGFFEFGTRKGGSLPRDLSVQPVQFRWTVLLSRCGYIISRWSSGRCSRPNDSPADQRTCPSCLCVDSALRWTEPLSSHLHFALRAQPSPLQGVTGEKGDTKGNVQRQGVTEAETRGDRHIRKDDPCHLCHTYVSPVNPETLLGVTPVTLVSCTENRFSPEREKCRFSPHLVVDDMFQRLSAPFRSASAGRVPVPRPDPPDKRRLCPGS